MGLFTRERTVREERHISGTEPIPPSRDSISKQIDAYCYRGGTTSDISVLTGNILVNYNTGSEAVRAIRKKLENGVSHPVEAYNAAMVMSLLNRNPNSAPFTRSIDRKLVDAIENVLRGPVNILRILLSEIIQEITYVLGGGSGFGLALISAWRHDPGILKLARLGDLAESVRVLPTS